MGPSLGGESHKADSHCSSFFPLLRPPSGFSNGFFLKFKSKSRFLSLTQEAAMTWPWPPPQASSFSFRLPATQVLPSVSLCCCFCLIPFLHFLANPALSCHSLLSQHVPFSKASSSITLGKTVSLPPSPPVPFPISITGHNYPKLSCAFICLLAVCLPHWKVSSMRAGSLSLLIVVESTEPRIAPGTS